MVDAKSIYQRRTMTRFPYQSKVMETYNTYLHEGCGTGGPEQPNGPVTLAGMGVYSSFNTYISRNISIY